MVRRTIARVMLIAAAWSLPAGVAAQARRPRHSSGAAAQPAEPTPPPAPADNGAMDFSNEPQQPAATEQQPAAGNTPPAGQETPSGGEVGLMGGEEVTAARHPLREDIFAVQQIYALRNHRVELSPSINVSLNDPFVSHTGFGLGANYWISNVLSVGVSGVFFQGLNYNSDINYHTARSTGLVVPINEYQLAAAVNFSYVPLYGKFSMFNRFIFHWDMYLMAGVGIMRTRPIAAVDPEFRTFDWGTRIMFDAGLGVRVFVTRSIGITAELRNYIYPELLENTSIGPETDAMGRANCTTCRRNPNTWTSQNALTDNVMLSLGVTIFLPFTFSYRLPK